MERHRAQHLHHIAAGKRQSRALIFVPLTGLLAVLLSASLAFAQQPTASTEQPTKDLITIPYPDMSGLEEAVQAQINDAHTDLRGWLRHPDPEVAPLASAFGRLGQILHAYELYEAAEACYFNAANLDPKNFRWRYYLGHVFQKNGKFEDAVPVYMSALQLEPRNLAAHVRLGEVLQAQNQTDKAMAAFRAALEIAPDNPAAQAYLGELALARGDHAEAAELLSAVLTRVPGANRLHYPLAMAYRGIGERDKALEHLDQVGVVGITVEDPLIQSMKDLATGERVHLLRGRQAFQAGSYGQAASEFRQALQADPNSVRVRVNLGSALGQMGDVLGAIEQFEKALAVNPANATAHYNLGLLNGQRGELEAAVENFRAAINAKADDGEFYYHLGVALNRLGRDKEALEEIHTATTHLLRHERAWLDKAVLLVSMKRYKEALETIEEALGNMPQSGQIAHALARLLASCPDKSLRDGQRALELAQLVYEASPSLGHAATVAQALAQMDRCPEAADWQSKAITAAEENGQTEWAGQQRPALERYLAGSPCN